MTKSMRVILLSLCLVFSFASQARGSIGCMFAANNMNAQEGGPPAQVPETQPDNVKQKTTKAKKKATKKAKEKKTIKKAKKNGQVEQGPPPDRVPQ
jgi:nucleosome binding factor SPN SPT16 subunit